MNSFPKYNSSRRTGDRGVTLVTTILQNEFDWIFRPTHLEEDFGIDGFFDILGTDNSVTGKSLGVQIKTGDSYFRNKTSNGWKYSGDNKHLNYYLNSEYPVLLLLVNLDSKKVYWVEFDIEKTDRGSSGWSIVVPEENVLDGNAKHQIQKLAGETIDYMSQIEYQWELNEKIKDSGLIILNIDRESIECNDTSGFTTLLNKFLINDDMIQKCRGKISFLIDGYNDDKREMYEIPEIREWVKKVLPEFKFWGYFLNMEDYIVDRAGLKMIQFCLVDTKISRFDYTTQVFVESDKEQTIELMNKLYGWLNEFTKKYGVSREINKEQSFKILNVFFPGAMKWEDY